MKHGRKTKERLAEAKARAQANREIWYALKMQIELAIRDGCESRSNTTPLKRQNVFAAPEQNYGI
jgi:hypothetical protein